VLIKLIKPRLIFAVEHKPLICFPLFNHGWKFRSNDEHQRETNTKSQSRAKCNAGTFSLWDPMISKLLLQHKLHKTVKIGKKIVINGLVVVDLLRRKYLIFIHIHLRRSTTPSRWQLNFFYQFLNLIQYVLY